MDDEPINGYEELGRVCFDSEQARRKNPRTRFIERSFVDGGMSVDRLDQADLQLLSVLHDQEGKHRNPPRTFHGWYVFSAETIRSVGWEVRPDGTLENPWHAEIGIARLTDGADQHRQNCAKVATLASWRERPMRREDEEFLDRVQENLG